MNEADDDLQTMPATRPDGKRPGRRVDYDLIPIPNGAYADPTLGDLWSGDYWARIRCLRKLWRRLRTGFYDRPRPSRKAPGVPYKLGKPFRPFCRARCRDGHACRARVCWNPAMGRMSVKCRMHGGLSSGPKTKAGKAASLAALAEGRRIAQGRRTARARSRAGTIPRAGCTGYTQEGPEA